MLSTTSHERSNSESDNGVEFLQSYVYIRLKNSPPFQATDLNSQYCLGHHQVSVDFRTGCLLGHNPLQIFVYQLIQTVSGLKIL